MNTTKTLKIVTTGAVLFAGAATVLLLHRSEARLEMLESADAQLNGDARELAQLRAEIRRLRAQVAGASGGPGSAAGRAGFLGPGGRSGFAAAAAASMNRPEMQKLMALQAGLALNGRYGALFKRLNLSPEKLAQLQELMVSRQMVGSDVFASAVDQGLDPGQDRSELMAMVADGQAKVDQQIQSLLGDADYQAYQGYQSTLPQRAVVSELQQALSYSADPLSDAQADQLVGILAANPASAQSSSQFSGAVGFVGGGGGDAPGPLPSSGSLISDAAVSAAQSILSSSQMSALQQLQQQQQQMSSIMQGLGGGGGPAMLIGGPPPG